MLNTGNSAMARMVKGLGLPWPQREVAYHVSGKVALITGGADGIGFALARTLHARGALVALVDVDPDRLAAARTALGAHRVLTATVDVRDREALNDALRTITAQAGGLDVVVANAGVTPPPATLRQIDPAAFDRVIDVNLTGAFNTVQAAANDVIARRGHIVIVSSAAAFTPGPGGAAYMISKAALEQLGRALRLELAGHGVTVGIAYFGFVDTQLARHTLDDDPLGRQLAARLPKPLRRRITPNEAATVLADAIARRAGRTLAPGAWQPWALLRGLVNVLADSYLAGNHELHALVHDLETERDTNTTPEPIASTTYRSLP